MIRHIVFFRLAENALGKTKADNAVSIKTQLEALKDEIPQIVSIEVGLNHNQNSSAWDIALVCEFRTKQDLEIYQTHPAHKKAAQFVADVRTDRAVVDYEV
ncbi:MAG: Dabb family protein [Chitinispirillaceae bacterium]